MCLAVPGRLVSRTDAGAVPMGHVEFGGIQREICLAYVPEVVVGQYVLVHVGFAISVVNEEEARRTLEMLEELGELAETFTQGPGQESSGEGA